MNGGISLINASNDFARSYVKFIRETQLELIEQHMNDSTDVIIPNFHRCNLDQNNHFLFEIINANQDSFDEWFEATAQSTSKLPIILCFSLMKVSHLMIYTTAIILTLILSLIDLLIIISLKGSEIRLML
jgi:hypothetical protein